MKPTRRQVILAGSALALGVGHKVRSRIVRAGDTAEGVDVPLTVHRSGGGTGGTPVTPLNGLYTGNTPTLATVATFQSWRGVAPVSVVSVFVQDQQWSDITNPNASSLTSGIFDRCVDHLSAGRTMNIAIPPFPQLTALGGITRSQALANAAGGSYDTNWNTLITNMVAKGLTSSKVTIRFAWEMNASFMHWGATNSTDAANYVLMWQRFTNLLRARSAALMMFCPNNTWGSGPTPADLYPGDTYVDVWAVDSYNQWFSGGAFPTSGTTTQKNTWWANCHDYQLNSTWGLVDHVQAAASHGKPFYIGEWGCITRGDGMGGTDDPGWVQAIWDLLHTTAPAEGATVFGQSYHDTTVSGEYTKIDPTTTYTAAPPVYQSLFGTGA